MAKKAAKPRRLYIPAVPAGASWIESDSYDRRAWSDIGAGRAGDRRAGRGGRPAGAALRRAARRPVLRAVQVQPGLAQARRGAEQRDSQSHDSRAAGAVARLRDAQEPHAARGGQGRDRGARARRAGARDGALGAAAQPSRNARSVGPAASGGRPRRARRRLKTMADELPATPAENDAEADPDEETQEERSRSSKRRPRAPPRSPRRGSIRRRGMLPSRSAMPTSGELQPDGSSRACATRAGDRSRRPGQPRLQPGVRPGRPASRPASGWNSDGISRATASSASWRGWSAASSRTRARCGARRWIAAWPRPTTSSAAPSWGG